MVTPTYSWRLGIHAMDLDANGDLPADQVPYDNATSGLTATNAQAAIDELAAGSGGAALVPYYIPVDGAFEVPLYRQALFAEAIEVDGALVVNGLLMGVD